jgi:signal transduction histidine kinase
MDSRDPSDARGSLKVVRSFPVVDTLLQSSLVVSLVALGVGSSTLARNYRSKLYVVFSLNCFIVFAWAHLFFLHQLWPDRGLYNYHLLMNVWLAPAGILLLHTILGARDRVSRAFLYSSAGLSILLSLALAGGLQRVQVPRQLMVFAPVLLVLQGLWVLIQGPRSLSQWSAQTQWILLGGLGVLMTSLMDHVPWVAAWIPVAGNLALAMYLLFLREMILRQGFFRVWPLLSRFAVLLGVALILTLLYLVLVAWIDDNPALFFLNSFFASFLILSLVEPLQTLSSWTLGRLRTRANRAFQRRVLQEIRRLGLIRDEQDFLERMTVWSREFFSPGAPFAFYTLSEDLSTYRLRFREPASSDPRLCPPDRIPMDHPLMEKLRLGLQREVPLLRKSAVKAEIERTVSRKDREGLGLLFDSLSVWGPEGLLVLVLSEEKRIPGFFLIGTEEVPVYWQDLLPLLHQGARVLRMTTGFERQREREQLMNLGEMAAGLAHEIRNPLGAIRGAAQWLAPELHGKSKDFAQVIVEETDRLDRVLTQFLQVSRPAPPQWKVVELREVLQKLKSAVLFDHSHPEVVSVVFVMKEEYLPFQLWVDPDQIQQILLNLVRNAREFSLAHHRSRKTEPPPVEVRIEVDQSLEPWEATLLVIDHGPGIEPERLGRIFIPFTSSRPGGTGLGLSISKRLAIENQGRLEVRSKVGEGSEFRLCLPIYSHALETVRKGEEV